MARTHGAGAVRFHQDDGVVLGKGGVPIPTTPTRGVPSLYPHGQPAAGVRHMDEGEIVPPPQRVVAAVSAAPVEYEWRCDRTTWGRSMDGFQALHLLNAMMQKLFGKELAVVLTDDEARQLPADTRWHFKRQIRQERPTLTVSDILALPEEQFAQPARANAHGSAPKVPKATTKPARKARVARKSAALGKSFDAFVLGALALGGDWTLPKLRELGAVTEGTGVTMEMDLRSLGGKMMQLTRKGLVQSLGGGTWRLAVRGEGE